MIVPASEFQKNFGHFKEVAQREPVTVTSNGRESVVLISATEYALLARLRHAHGGGASEALMKDAAETYEKHKVVLDGLGDGATYGSGADEAFERDLAEVNEAHKDVLDGLSR